MGRLDRASGAALEGRAHQGKPRAARTGFQWQGEYLLVVLFNGGVESNAAAAGREKPSRTAYFARTS
jgi:hypothetical protein